jgi:putative ABC transport system permease protein
MAWRKRATLRPWEEDCTVTLQDAMLTRLRKFLNIVSWVLGATAAISLLVDGIGIMNILLVSVGERPTEIGRRKAVGARRRDILGRVLLEALALSSIGTFIEVCAGAGGAIAVGNIFPCRLVRLSGLSGWRSASLSPSASSLACIRRVRLLC